MEERRRHSDAAIAELRATVELIRKDVSDILVKVAITENQVMANHKSICDSVNKNSSWIKKHDEIIFGNGHKGLTSMRDEMKNLDENFERHVKYDMWIQGTYAVSQVAVIGMLLKIVMGMGS